jgi:hypothetical protein
MSDTIQPEAREQALSPAQALVQAIDRNTRAILAMARLLSERLPLHEDVLLTDEGPVKRSQWTQAQSEAAYRSRLGWAAEAPLPSVDRDMIEQALAKARAGTPQAGDKPGDLSRRVGATQ